MKGAGDGSLRFYSTRVSLPGWLPGFGRLSRWLVSAVAGVRDIGRESSLRGAGGWLRLRVA